MTLYLKYRSKTIEELDLKEVRESLSKIINSGKIPHAFLFSGPKGSGKTSAARILAKIVNCEKLGKDGSPCGKCDNCRAISKGESLDVLELDAASHRGIDDIRALREAVKLAPAKAKKKIYIIDEAHMLTTEAGNALLKTLEEPPDHVIFILATTNPEKLLETIRSRVVTIGFRKASVEEITRALSRVVRGEGLKFEKEAIELIANSADGSFRDAIKILEQLSLEGDKFTKSEVENFLFNRKAFDLEVFINYLVRKDAKEAFLLTEKALAAGVSVKTIITLSLTRLRTALLAKVGISDSDITDLSQDDLLALLKLLSRSLSELPYSVLDQIPLEVAIAEWCQSGDGNVTTDSTKAKNTVTKDSVSKKNNSGKATSEPEKQNKTLNKTHSNGFSQDIWVQVLSQIRTLNTSTEALLRASQPIDFDGKTLTLGVYYQFHKEKLESTPHRDILEKILEEIVGGGVRVACTLTQPPAKILKEEISISSEVNKKGGAVVLAEGEDEEIIRVAKEIFGS